MDKFLELVGWGILLALLFFGWPKIVINRHYHTKDDGQR